MTTTPTLWLAPILVNSTDAGPDNNDQTRSQVIALADGRFFVAWNDNGNAVGLGAPDIYGRFLDAEGHFGGGPLAGNDFLLNGFIDFQQGAPAIARGPNGGFTLVYQTTTDPIFVPLLGEGVPIDRFNQNGIGLGAPGLPWINSTADETAPAIAAFADGSSVVVFEDNAAGDKDLRFRVIDAAGNIGAEFDVAAGAGDQAGPDVAVLSATQFVTAFVTGSGANHNIEFAIRQTDGTSIASGTVDADVADETDPSVAVLTGGGFSVVWTDAAADGSGSAVMARAYTAAGVPLPARPAAFIVPTTIAGDQKTPSIAALADGGFVIVWDDDAAGEIRGQRFDASAAAVGAQFTIAAMSDVSDPDVTLLDDGRFAVSFTNTVAANSDIYVAIFDPRTSPVEGTAAGDVLTSRIEGATVFGRGGADTLLGQGGDDVLYGGLGDDQMFGGAGADRLFNDGGTDTMTGGLGSDWYFIRSGATIVEDIAGGESVDRVFSSGNFTLAAGVGIEIISTDSHVGTGAINLTGNELNNTIIGNAGDNVIDGKGGADILYGLGGNDTYFVDNASDHVVEFIGGGTDRVYASLSYSLDAGMEVETLSTDNDAGVAALALYGNELANTLIGNAGSNLLHGGGGADAMQGLGGNDSYFVDNAGDTIVEGNGEGANDRIFTTVSYTLGAGVQVEQLSTTHHAGIGAINLSGNERANIIIGNAGANEINGFGGNDLFYGLGGADVFTFSTAPNPANNIDRIADFLSVDDEIHLDDAAFTGMAAGVLAAVGFLSGAGLTSAATLAQRVIHDTATGDLWWDQDGLGGIASVRFANIGVGTAVSAGDFFGV